MLKFEADYDIIYMFILDSIYEAVFKWILFSCLVFSNSECEDNVSEAVGSKRQRLEVSQVCG